MGRREKSENGCVGRLDSGSPEPDDVARGFVWPKRGVEIGCIQVSSASIGADMEVMQIVLKS
jgi:hypothetical protein